MKFVALFVLVMVLGLCGCSRSYVITLQNGRRVVTASKPQFKGGNYIFKDAKGRASYVSASRVREVAPASMAGGTSGDFMKGPGQQ